VFRSNYFYTELALFADAGVAFNYVNGNELKKSLTGNLKSFGKIYDHPFICSTGVSLRFNLFGMLVIEPFYAIPFQLGGFNSAYIGVNFLPGW
jgi:hypothetical protein